MIAWVLLFFLEGCTQTGSEVVIYTSLDQNLSEPVLKSFEKKTGIRVKAVYDVEANKTVGLVNRLIAEKNRPRADVFWNSETGHTIRLQKQGLLSIYSYSKDLPKDTFFYDSGGYWTGFAARGRVILVNNNEIETQSKPDQLEAFTDTRWKGKCAIANPHFGSTGTHFSALYTIWGKQKFKNWLQAMRDNLVAVLPGNAQVRNRVANGEYVFGLTDTDDANGALEDSKPVSISYPDQGSKAMGMFLFPNTVALIKNGPNPEQGKKLIDYLLSVETEGTLAAGRGALIPLRTAAKAPANLLPLTKIRAMQVDFNVVEKNYISMISVFDEVWGDRSEGGS